MHGHLNGLLLLHFVLVYRLGQGRASATYLAAPQFAWVQGTGDMKGNYLDELFRLIRIGMENCFDI